MQRIERIKENNKILIMRTCLEILFEKFADVNRSLKKRSGKGLGDCEILYSISHLDLQNRRYFLQRTVIDKGIVLTDSILIN